MADKANGVELLPCPFCGSPADRHEHDHPLGMDYIVLCSARATTCPAAEVYCSGETRESADADWNTRPSDDLWLRLTRARFAVAQERDEAQAKLEAAERDALEERASWMKVCEASHYRRLREKFGWDSKFCRARAKAEAERIAYCIDAQRQEGK